MPVQFINQLKEKLQNTPLPGQEAQLKMAHNLRGHKLIRHHVPDDARKASILVLLYPHEEELHLVLMQRQSKYKENDKHSGQISFPGGGYEEIDKTFERNALRETREEIGVPEDAITVLGKLTDLYIPVSKYMVYPFVGFVPERPQFELDDNEVKYVIEVPLSHLQNPENKKTTTRKLNQHITLQDVPYYDVFEHVVWGATAMMLSEFLEVVETIDN